MAAGTAAPCCAGAGRGAEDQQPVWAVHVLADDGRRRHTIEVRDRPRAVPGPAADTPADPAAARSAGPLSGTVGPVLDPVFALRRRVRLEAGAAATVAFSTGVADTPRTALALADQYQTAQAVTRAFELAWAPGRRRAAPPRPGGGGGAPVPAAGRTHPLPRPGAARAGRSAEGQHARAERPVAARHLRRPAHRAGSPGRRQRAAAVARGARRPRLLAREGAQGGSGPAQRTPGELFRGVARAVARPGARQRLATTFRSTGPAAVFVRKASHLAGEDHVLLLAVGPRRPGRRSAAAGYADRRPRSAQTAAAAPPLSVRRRRPFADAAGGQRPATCCSSTASAASRRTAASTSSPPARCRRRPWVNVIANPGFGFLVSDSGAGCTWVGNSQSNRLTRWSNDPVSPIRPARRSTCATRHRARLVADAVAGRRRLADASSGTGPGYTVFEQVRDGLEQELTLFVAAGRSRSKLLLLRVKNRGATGRGGCRRRSTPSGSSARRADRPPCTSSPSTRPRPERSWRATPSTPTSARRVAFAAVSECGPCSHTGDRAEFLGRNRPAAAPAGLEQVRLSGRTGPGLDPCAAIQAPFDVRPGEDKELVFLLGEAGDVDAARRLVKQYRDVTAAKAAAGESPAVGPTAGHGAGARRPTRRWICC